jgi:hypothetical protein
MVEPRVMLSEGQRPDALVQTFVLSLQLDSQFLSLLFTQVFPNSGLLPLLLVVRLALHVKD